MPIDKKTIFVLICVFLQAQGLLFYDEGAMLNRADSLTASLMTSNSTQDLSKHYTDTKMLWLILIVVGQWMFQGIPAAANILSALFGLMTITLTYLFTLRFYKSQAIAFLSAVFLSLSSLHVFYSRLALPESTGTFFCLLSLYFYFLSREKGKTHIIYAALFWVIAFLTSRFRVILFPLFMLIFELTGPAHSSSNGRKNKLHFPLFIFSALAFMLLYSIMGSILISPDIISPKLYFSALSENAAKHALFQTDLLSMLTYFFYIYTFESIGIVLLFVCAFCFLKNKSSPALPLAFCFIQIVFCSLVDEKGVRSISVILPLLSIVCGVALYNIYLNVREHSLKNISLLIIVLLCSPGLFHCFQILTFHSDIPKAVEWIKKKDSSGGILSTSTPIVKFYAQENNVAQFNHNWRGLYKQGYNYILTDPGRFILGDYTGFWNDDRNRELFDAVEANCEPEVTFKHFNKHLLRQYLLEHTRPTLTRMLALLGQTNDRSGQIKVYETYKCLTSLNE